MIDVIAVFDIGKTNKKFLLFDAQYNLVYQQETSFDEIADDDGFPCEDMSSLERWMKKCLSDTFASVNYLVEALNFSAYGASLVYLDEVGHPITPMYNYLKPFPDKLLHDFYERYSGVEEFCRVTGSPELGMLNSGLQILWLKKQKEHFFSKVKNILHLPQYLSFLFTGKIASEYTSIGCHTTMWDFDHHAYHRWLSDEGITLPKPLPNSTVSDKIVEGQILKTGIGIHDSSASLVPYLMASNEPFILISTGTWCIMMNPFNDEPLTAEQLRHDSLCYLSAEQKAVKSSRFFMGHIHHLNVERLSANFKVAPDFYRHLPFNNRYLNKMKEGDTKRVFFKNGVPSGYVDESVDLIAFENVEEAYNRLMFDLVELCMESLKLIIPKVDTTKIVYITGGFSRNVIFINLMTLKFPGKKVYTSEIDNSSALGAMMVVYEQAFGTKLPEIDLKLKEVGKH